MRLGNVWTSLALSRSSEMVLNTTVGELTVFDVRLMTPADRRTVLGVDSFPDTTAAQGTLPPPASPSGKAPPPPQSPGGVQQEGAAPRPSLLSVDLSKSPTEGTGVSVRLQRPTLMVDVGFLLAVGRFFVPSLAGGTAESAVDVLPRDIRVPPSHAGCFSATEDVILGPTRRILADRPSEGTEYVFDGRGHALVLPPEPYVNVADAALNKVILVGPGCTLAIRNARIVRAERLEACAQMLAGGHIDVGSTCKLVYGDGGGKHHARHDAAVAAAEAAAAAASSATAKPSGPAAMMHVEVDIIGAALRFVEMAKPGETDVPMSAYGWVGARFGGGLRYNAQGGEQAVGLQVRSLSLAGHIPGHHRTIQVLSPTDLAATYTSAGKDTVARVGLTTSSVDLRVSPPLLTLLGRLASSTTAVLSKASVKLSDQFELVWRDSAFDAADGQGADQHHAQGGAKEAVVFSSDDTALLRALSLWRPVLPPGYASLGDCATAGARRIP